MAQKSLQKLKDIKKEYAAKQKKEKDEAEIKANSEAEKKEA